MGILNLHRSWSTTSPAEHNERRVDELKELERGIEIEHRIGMLREYQEARERLLHARAELFAIEGEVGALIAHTARLQEELWPEKTVIK